MKNSLLIFLLPIIFFSSCEKNNSFKKNTSSSIEYQLEKEVQELSKKIENENYKDTSLKKEEYKESSKKSIKDFSQEKEIFSEKDLELKNLNLSEDFSASLTNADNSNLENKCKSIKHKIFTFDKIEDWKCFLKSNKKITEKYWFFWVKIDFINWKFKNPVYYQCGFDFYSNWKVCNKIKVDCGSDLKCLKFNIRKWVSIKYLENVEVPVPFVFMKTWLVYKSKRIIKFSSKWFKDEFFKWFSNPWTCISVVSKCNKCTRKNRNDKFICTKNFCENEKFRCWWDNWDILQDNWELKISFNENVWLEVVYDEDYLNDFANKIKKESLKKNPNDKKWLEGFKKQLNEIKNNKKWRDDFFKDNYKKDDKTGENQKHFCKFSSIFKVQKYIDKKQKELEKLQNWSFSFSTKDYWKLPEWAITCEWVWFEKDIKSLFEKWIKIETKFDWKK